MINYCDMKSTRIRGLDLVFYGLNGLFLIVALESETKGQLLKRTRLIKDRFCS